MKLTKDAIIIITPAIMGLIIDITAEIIEDLNLTIASHIFLMLSIFLYSVIYNEKREKEIKELNNYTLTLMEKVNDLEKAQK